ncbi:MAG TPA: ABC transporter substrate-binding protein [Bacilli bacterium]|nr:ABC transporter substrate-binding protein [Bacilli bacterium]
MTKQNVFIAMIAVAVLFATYLAFELFPKPTTIEGDLTITHMLGDTVVKRNPTKVVVFDYGVLETLDQLEVEVIGLPKSSLPSKLSKYASSQYTDVGTLFEPNFELLYTLSPELIIISHRQLALYDQLSEIAPTIYLGMNNTSFIDSFEQNMLMLGQIFDKTEEQVALVEQVRIEVEVVNTVASSSNLKVLVIMVNANNISALGVGSRFDVVHTDFGAIPADPNIAISQHGQNVTFEYIHQINPDILLIVDRGMIVEGGGGAAQLLDNEFINQTKAAQTGKMIYLDAVAWYITTGGSDSIAIMMDDLLRAFE